MTPETLDKLFKLDENAHKKGTDQEVGTGLGLILTKELTELNDGTISVKSALGKGSSFSTTFS
jgi:signal transduction histidine kinase